ncbi:SNF2 family DNA or RNA helicase [Paenibacillus sp. LBL]|nr:SNF2 family DNA or RNA helicase [Paenibacillus sp. LBL]
MVQVHKLINMNTLEEKIDSILSYKQELLESMLTSSNANSIFDEDNDNLSECTSTIRFILRVYFFF